MSHAMSKIGFQIIVKVRSLITKNIIFGQPLVISWDFFVSCYKSFGTFVIDIHMVTFQEHLQTCLNKESLDDFFQRLLSTSVKFGAKQEEAISSDYPGISLKRICNEIIDNFASKTT